MPDNPSILFLADGGLFRLVPGQRPEPIESQFVRAAEDRRALTRERQGFRSQGMMWNITQQQAPQVDMRLFKTQDGEARLARFTGVSTGPSGHEAYYSLQTDAVGGLFLYDFATQYERRLLHRQGLVLRDLARCPASGDVACSLPNGDGTANLGLMNGEGGALKEITSGDSVDQAPAWSARRPQTLLFQSAGVGRHDGGMVVGIGPYALCELDLANGELKTRIEDHGFDYLLPREAADGSLYYIRRPFTPGARVSPLHVAKDIALFPFRLARAFVHFLNSFSMFFSNEPLMTAGGPKREGPNRRNMMLWGRWVEIDRRLKTARADADIPLVPSDWKLIRRAPDGQETVLASSVVAYDLAADGSILHTNGTSIRRTEADGETQRLGGGKYVERVMAMG